ncbi:MAG: hypothetical protein BM562_13370 [Alphaproteobacteria bacterium MedPE-SWcel]|nr:MAG: hypothetical protein BM562_13370 [Alphaproteobacteria bacterium MedPE-SWcel]
MSWLGLWHRDAQYFDAAGLTPEGERSRLLLQDADALLARGSLVMEFHLPDSRKLAPLIRFEQGGDWPFHLAVTAVPGAGINLVLDHYGGSLRRTVKPALTAGADALRLTYSWDAPSFRGRLALERLDGGRADILEIEAPRPWRLQDLRNLLTGARPGGSAGAQPGFVAQNVDYIALSSDLEPVGPMPGLSPDTPLETDQGPRPIGQLKRGDLLRSSSGKLVPVLHVIARQVPAFGAFRPVLLRAPYFGLKQDLQVAPCQRLVLSGTDVDYHFGCDAVLAPAEVLATTRIAAPVGRSSVLTTYMQVVLPGQEVPVAAGLGVESLFLGRIRRDPVALSASLLAGLDRNSLPEHAPSCCPVVRAFDAAVLTEQRIA